MLTELRRSLPTVRALSGSAEAIPLPDASVDAVLADKPCTGSTWPSRDPRSPGSSRPAASWQNCGTSWTMRSSGFPGSRGSAAARPSAHVTPPPTGAPRRQTCTSQRMEYPPGSAHRSRRCSRTGSAAPPTVPSGPSRRARGVAGHAGPDPGFPRESTGDRPRQVHYPDADKRAARPAAAKQHIDTRPVS
ncbi:hypothetical protein [Streptomyces sp. IB201691-2A2]|uniref:hypothetical protein n=1 Tax=Streptomyces sp. IB201691-2A2 TaxID=2561920 RepID=UPI0037D9C3BD